MKNISLKQALWLLAAAALLCVIAAGLVLVKVRSEAAAAATAAPTLASGYLYHTADAATFLRVVSDAGGTVSGIWYGSIRNSDGTVSSYTGTVSGTISSAGHLVLTFTGVGADTDTAVLSSGGKTLTLQVQQSDGQITSVVYHAGTVAEYNAAVAALEQRK